VTIVAVIENLDDLTSERLGQMRSANVRKVEVSDALVDSGATGLLMPKHLIARLGLVPLRTRNAKAAGGVVSMQVYRAARLTIQGRDCILDVTEIGDDLPVLIGQIPLESMDWVIDRQGQKLIGNPAHGNEQMIEVF